MAHRRGSRAGRRRVGGRGAYLSGSGPSVRRVGRGWRIGAAGGRTVRETVGARVGPGVGRSATGRLRPPWRRGRRGAAGLRARPGTGRRPAVGRRLRRPARQPVRVAVAHREAARRRGVRLVVQPGQRLHRRAHRRAGRVRGRARLVPQPRRPVRHQGDRAARRLVGDPEDAYEQQRPAADRLGGRGLGAGWARAAELIRSTYPGGWPNADRFATLLRTVYLPVLSAGSGANGNWELIMTDALMGVAVFLGDRTAFNRAVSRWRGR